MKWSQECPIKIHTRKLMLRVKVLETIFRAQKTNDENLNLLNFSFSLC